MSFDGFRRPTTTDTPDELFDVILPQVTSLAELKVIMYVVRHTFGYNKWLDHISLSEFERGITTKGKDDQSRRIDAGVGLSRRGIIDGLKAAMYHEYLRRVIICPACYSEVHSIQVERAYKHRSGSGTVMISDVPARCPTCRRPLKGHEHIYYGLRWKDGQEPALSPRDVLAKYRGWKNSEPGLLRGSASSSLDVVKQAHSQQSIPSAFTSGVPDGALCAPVASPTLDPDAGNGNPSFTTGLSGNGNSARGAVALTGEALSRHSASEWLSRLSVVLDDTQAAQAFESLLTTIEAQTGLTDSGFRTAALGLQSLPDRRRRVLDDLRRMQARANLKPARRKQKVIAILAQNIGVTLGLGLNPDGHHRIPPDASDYAAIGGLVGEYGAERVWTTACEVAGAAIEGDPLDYLRAALRWKRERENSQVRQPGSHSTGFEQLDYLSSQTPNVEST
jgi:hypothetical protein